MFIFIYGFVWWNQFINDLVWLVSAELSMSKKYYTAYSFVIVNTKLRAPKKCIHHTHMIDSSILINVSVSYKIMTPTMPDCCKNVLVVITRFKFLLRILWLHTRCQGKILTQRWSDALSMYVLRLKFTILHKKVGGKSF